MGSFTDFSDQILLAEMGGKRSLLLEGETGRRRATARLTSGRDGRQKWGLFDLAKLHRVIREQAARARLTIAAPIDAGIVS